jgi:hypothetical protein
MARNPKQPLQTRKHLARLERERIQRRNILIVSTIVAVVIFGLLAYGLVDQLYLQGIRPVAEVNREKITTGEFQAQARYTRQRLIGNAVQTFQFMQYFGSSPETQASFQSQLMQAQAQLEPISVGQQVVDQLVDDALVRQEAEKRGITVSKEELDEAVQEAFGYFADGTPTPKPTTEPVPTSTLNPTQLALVPPTSTPTATPEITATVALTGTEIATNSAQTEAPASTATPTGEPTVTPTLAPSATPTPYTLEGFRTFTKRRSTIWRAASSSARTICAT